MAEETFEINLQPIGRRVEIAAGGTLLDATQQAGVELVAVCGGDGICGDCKVRLIQGRLSELTESEKAELTDDELARGFRLACQARPLTAVRIDIPPSR